MRLRRLAFAAALLCPLGSACDKEQLAEAAVPDAGVTMVYDLTPGQTYQGHVEQRTVLESPMGNIDMRLEYDLNVIVTGTASADGPLLAATFDNIEANAIMPGGIPPEVAGFDPKVAKTLNGVELRFNMNEGGEVENMPELPEGQPPAIQVLLGQMTGGLQSAFARMPDKPLKKGESWSRDRNEDGNTVTMKGVFKDFGTDASGATIATLETESSGTIKREADGQSIEGNMSGLSTIAFVTSEGYAKTLERQVRQTSNMGSVSLEFDITWTKGEKKAVEASTAAEVQAVTDPCDADYVGGEVCPDDAQAITDPCDADYVGPEPCADEADASEAAPSGNP
ncbi:MAG: hypothetical protein ACE37F_35065 [Nannocystaceae bacterium]|nr:hypothetical protein [bacterium]